MNKRDRLTVGAAVGSFGATTVALVLSASLGFEWLAFFVGGAIGWRIALAYHREREYWSRMEAHVARLEAANAHRHPRHVRIVPGEDEGAAAV